MDNCYGIFEVVSASWEERMREGGFCREEEVRLETGAGWRYFGRWGYSLRGEHGVLRVFGDIFWGEKESVGEREIYFLRGDWAWRRSCREVISRLLVRKLHRGKLAGFVGIGGGLKAFTAKQSLTGKGFFQVWMQLIYCLIWILITPLCFLLMFECLLVCLGWIMKATCCLLRYNPESMSVFVNLGVPCLCYEIPKNPSNICI